MDAIENEVVHFLSDNMRCWVKPKPAMTKLNTFLGRILITDQRFLFLSTGSSKLREQAAPMILLGPLLGPLLLGTSQTRELDMSDLKNVGSIEQAIMALQRGEVKTRWDFSKFLALKLADGTEVSFMKDPFGYDTNDFKQILQLIRQFRG